MSIAISFENISKQYRLGEVGTGTICRDLERVWARLRGKPDPFATVGQVNNRTLVGGDLVWALKDIQLDVEKGGVLGIIGRNGAGKSTLLKLLSRVTAPTTGTIKVRGRITSLLEVGTGFHPELTGKENIFLNGTILGMTRREITKRLDEIISFSGCAKYIDTPVKRYSTGMTVRLGFSVAAHLDCEILVVDEVLAVGDVEFQQKCLGRMESIGQTGKTIIFVSHNLASVQTLCDKTLLLDNGGIADFGRSSDIVAQYLKLNWTQEEASVTGTFADANAAVALDQVAMEDQTGKKKRNFDADENIVVRTQVNIQSDSVVGFHLYMRVHNSDGILVFATGSWDTDNIRFVSGINNFAATIPAHLLNCGDFTVSIDGQIPQVRYLFQHENAIGFSVTTINAVGGTMSAARKGVVRPEIAWSALGR